MPFTVIGFDGTMTEDRWVSLHRLLAPKYTVATTGSLKPTAGGAGDRAVTIAAGGLEAIGARADLSEATTLNLGSVASGSRYDLIAVRINWTTNTAALVVIPGSSSAAIPTRNLWSAGSQIEDVPIALFRATAGSSVATLYADLRLWAGGSGLYVALHTLALTLFESNADGHVGTQVRIGDITYTRMYDGSSSSWKPDRFTLIAEAGSIVPFSKEFVINDRDVRRDGDLVSFYVRIVRKVNDLVASGTPNPGYLTNQQILQLTDARFQPKYRGVLASGEVGPITSASVRSDGRMFLAELPPSGRWAADTSIEFAGVYLGKDL